MFRFNLCRRWTPASARERLRNGSVPREMRVAGRLDLSNSVWLAQLPRVLEADSIDISGCPRLMELPHVVKCTELMLQRTHIRRLPTGLQVSWKLDASGCECLQAVGALRAAELNLRDCTALVHLADGLRVQHLDLSNCASLTELPAGLVHLRTLNLRGCTNLTALPCDIRVLSWVEVADSGIKSLPQSLSSTQVVWRGVRVPDRVAFHPETITVREILRETNSEMRRVLLDRVGREWFYENARPEVVDSDSDAGGVRRLLRVPFGEGEDFVSLEVRCPSTGRKYLLRVPPQLPSCEWAAAWLAD